ncbi:MAG: hypothetical protein MZU79_04935 [Anaerotruncus sp.]|nr:hypothetical protein [Anaerotruncus sp.]
MKKNDLGSTANLERLRIAEPGGLLRPLPLSPARRPLHGRGLHRLDRPALLPLRPAAGPGDHRLGAARLRLFRLLPRHRRRDAPLRPLLLRLGLPLGALHQFSSFVFKRTKFLKPPREDKASLAPKYYILIAVLAGAVFGLDLAGYLDPFSFLTRSFSVAVLPSLAHALSRA